MNTFRVIKPVDFSSEIIKEVIDLGMRSGIWHDSDVEYYKEQFLNPRNINIVCQNEGNGIIGYALAKPHNEAVKDYLIEDPEMKENVTRMFYVDIVIADKSQKRASVGMRLVDELIQESHKRGVYRFSLHCRVSSGLSEFIKEKFKAGLEVTRKIDHYIDCNNEPCDYMEIVVLR